MKLLLIDESPHIINNPTVNNSYLLLIGIKKSETQIASDLVVCEKMGFNL